MYCTHQQWLLAPEIDYFSEEREIFFSLKRKLQASWGGSRGRTTPTLPISSTRWNEPDSLLRISHKAVMFHFSFLLRSFFVLSAFNSFDIQLNQI